MAIAGEARVSALRLKLEHGALRNQGHTMQVPVQATYSKWRCGMGSLEDAAAALKAGATVVVDVRGGSYLELQQLVKEA
jgi:hypothetical protein